MWSTLAAEAQVRWGSLLLVACGAIESPDDFFQIRAKAECKQIERCQRGSFDSEYSSFDDCVNEAAAGLTDEHEYFVETLDCVYVPDEAGKCVSLIQTMSCEDWQENDKFLACDLVYECLGGGFTTPTTTELE
jgi:hypothetical protein